MDRHTLTVEIDSNSDKIRLTHTSKVLPPVELNCKNPIEVAQILEEIFTRLISYPDREAAWVSISLINEDNKSTIGEW